MWLSDTSIKQPVLITMAMVATIIVGAVSYARMEVNLLPEVTFPVVAVSTGLPGASPEEVETQVTKPVENSLASISNIEAIRSSSSEGVSVIVVEFDLDQDLDEGANSVRDALEDAKAELPEDATDPTVSLFNPSAAPVLVYSVASTGDSMTPRQLRRFVEDNVKPRLERAEDVGQVRVSGGAERQINILLNLDALRARSVSIQELSQALRQQNLSIPGGRVTQGGRDLTIKTSGEFERVADIENVVIALRNGTPIYLRDVAKVEDTAKERRLFSRLNGQDSITITILKQSGGNTVDVARAVEQVATELQNQYAELHIELVRDESKSIKESNDEVSLALLLGAIFASLVVLLFFRDIRNTLVTVAGLPVVILATFWVISILGFSINIMTLLALSLSIGLLVDDAIVVRENIFRHMERGKTPRAAAADGTAEVSFAVIATTLTILAVFIPVGFAGGIIGQFFREFGVTVAVAAAISTVEAFTLAPMLSAYFFKQVNSEEYRQEVDNGWFTRGYARLSNGYQDFLGWALGHRKTIVAGAFLVFLGSMSLVPLLSFQFFGEDDEGRFGASLEMPPGTALEETDFMARYLEQYVLAQPEVDTVYTTVGGGSGLFATSGSERASFFIRLKEIGGTGQFVERMRHDMGDIPGIAFSNQSVGGESGTASLATRQILLSVQGGENIQELAEISNTLIERIAAIPGTADIDHSYKLGKPEIQVTVDAQRAADLGVNAATAAATVRTLVNGDAVSKLRAGDASETDIYVQLRETDRGRSGDILAITVPTNRGAQVPLSSVVSIETVDGPTQLDRLEREPLIQVGANAVDVTESTVIGAVQEIIDEMTLTPGVTISFAGNAQASQESFQELLIAVMLAIVFVYMVLASQFGSFIHPFTIMLSLPLAFGGAFLGLLIVGKPMDVMAMIGLIMLMGLVTKNAILLLDFIIRARRAGISRTAAILRSGPIRLRPILMTTLAMIAGMTPVALGVLGPGSAWRAPMAIAVIGGLIASTVLTLVVVPIVYSILDDLQGLFKRSGPELERPQETTELLPVAAGERE